MNKSPYQPYDNFIADFFKGLLIVALGFAVLYGVAVICKMIFWG